MFLQLDNFHKEISTKLFKSNQIKSNIYFSPGTFIGRVITTLVNLTGVSIDKEL